MVIIMATAVISLQAAPAIRKPLTIQQPDGSTITILQHGDEWCHWVTDLEGQLLVLDENGNYHPATPSEAAAWETTKAANLQRRDEINNQRMANLKAGRKGTPAITEPGENHAANFPSKGQINGLIVLVQYSDISFADDSVNIAQHYQDMINSEGYDQYYHQGSAHDYYIQNSQGQFDPQFDIYGPITLDHKRQYYGKNDAWGNDSHAYEMLTEACQKLDSIVDFTKYDNDGDGFIDFIFGFYAGGGEHAGAGSNTVWPHAWEIMYATSQVYEFDGVRLNKYACSCETIYGQPDGVGTFCHEFTHVLGLPDIYDVNYSYSTFTPGAYDVLDQGSYNGITNGSCPAALNTYERYELGWIEPEELVSGTQDTLFYLGESNKAYILPVKSPTSDPRDGEYYLFENRQQKGWDSDIPGHGMLVWHIDYQEYKWGVNNVNTTSYHQCVDIVEADNVQSGQSVQSDPFPGMKGICEFSATTKPALLGWDSPSSRTMTQPLNDAALSDIKEVLMPELSSSNVIVFDFTDQSTPEEIPDTIVTHCNILLEETFESVTIGSDTKANGSSTPFKGNENFPAYSNTYQAGGAIRLGKLNAPGSLTTRTLGNAEGDSLIVEIMVKGWLTVEGQLKVSSYDQELQTADETQTFTLDYSATMDSEYELLTCTLTDCNADTQLIFETTDKRCFISNIRIYVPETPSDLDVITIDRAPSRATASKIWRNGQLIIDTGNGLYNMQGVRQ